MQLLLEAGTPSQGAIMMLLLLLVTSTSHVMVVMMSRHEWLIHLIPTQVLINPGGIQPPTLRLTYSYTSRCRCSTLLQLLQLPQSCNGPRVLLSYRAIPTATGTPLSASSLMDCPIGTPLRSCARATSVACLATSASSLAARSISTTTTTTTAGCCCLLHVATLSVTGWRQHAQCRRPGNQISGYIHCLFIFPRGSSRANSTTRAKHTKPRPCIYIASSRLTMLLKMLLQVFMLLLPLLCCWAHIYSTGASTATDASTSNHIPTTTTTAVKGTVHAIDPTTLWLLLLPQSLSQSLGDVSCLLPPNSYIHCTHIRTEARSSSRRRRSNWEMAEGMGVVVPSS
jgi:hypothetical protein